MLSMDDWVFGAFQPGHGATGGSDEVVGHCPDFWTAGHTDLDREDEGVAP